MSKRISDTSAIDIAQILSSIWSHTKPQKTFEDLAQTCTEALYREFADSIVLTRTFITVPFKHLPQPNQQWVRELSKKTGVFSLLTPEVPVLSLVATAGGQEDWNDRRKSQGHVGIPLVSAQFIQNIPMMMRLIGQVTGGLDWLDTQDRNLQKRVMGNFSGTFFVEDAQQDTDEMNRHIIAAQDFVTAHGVRSVFGIGGGYSSGAFAVLLIFTRETLQRSRALAFLPAFNVFRSISNIHASDNTIFNDFLMEDQHARLHA